jgi:UDP-2,4-diacetamido-2,4,6-trideoxy-beta-L-altropyranose hydrolase
MRKKVNIRVDGNAVIGHGHIVRCQALAQMLSDQFDCRFFCKTLPKTVQNALLSAGFDVNVIENEEHFFGFLHPGDLVVVDGYEFDYTYQTRLRGQQVILIVIDDLVSGKYAADVIINHAPGNVPADYEALPGTHFALGPDFALIRRSYQQKAQEKLPVNDPDTVFVCFGGSDPKALTLVVVKELIDSGQFGHIVVVTGTGFQQQDELRELIAGKPFIESYSGLSENEMIDQMLRCSLAVVPSSGMLFEALALKRTVVSGRYIANQERLYSQFNQLNAFSDAGTFEPEEVRRALKEARENPCKSVQFIDGFAPLRLQNLFSGLENTSALRLRRALPEDVDITYKWANDPVIRAHAFSREPIPRESHAGWFLKKIGDRLCYYFLAFENDQPAGSIRFDLNGHEAIISYLLDPAFHGRGYGTQLLKNGIELLLADRSFQLKKIAKITGLVLPENIPSVKSFEKLNFEASTAENALKFSYCI